MKKIFTTLVFIGFLSCFLQAQIVPPDFQCVKGDTLFWGLPTNNCGPFVSYDVFTSTNANGPFALLVSVTDPAQNFYYDPNPSGELRYYFLESNYNCPGETALPSDTLDSRPPEVSPLNAVTVAGGDVQLTWQASPSPEVSGYIIYRRDPIGVVPIDTVPVGTTAYLDTNAAPDVKSESYFVNALDPCGNTSIFDLEHFTVFLEGSPTSCDISLNWNLYQNWPNGIGEQEIWVGTNGAAPILFQAVDPDATSFLFTEVNNGDAYCFFVQAVESGTGVVSQSNEYCVNTTFVQPVNELFLTNINVEQDNSVTVDWGMNDGANVVQVDVFREDAIGAFVNISTENPQGQLPPFNQYFDPTANAELGSQTYQISVADGCGNELATPSASTIFLTGNQPSLTSSQLNWSGLVLPNASVSDYEIFRIAGGAETSVGVVSSSVLSFEDNFDISAIADGTICYYIVATGEVLSPNGVSIPFSSRSNRLCLDQAIKIFAPNALAPDGFNQEFKPVILSGSIAQYEMQVFDRYGGIVFSANAPEVGWKGKKNGKKLPQGVYVYRIVVVLENGDRAEKKGNVVLLR